jgi:hypothetical protein
LPQHLFVVYSCRAYEGSRVKWQARTWPRRLPAGATLLTTTGAGDGRIDDEGVLRLDCPDDYNGLFDKTQALFDWFLEERTEEFLVKVDDDVWLSPEALERIVAARGDYLGGYYSSYAGGPLYLVSRSLLARLGRLRSFIVDANVAEDVAVGRAAAAAGCRGRPLGFEEIKWYDHRKDTLKGDHAWHMAFAFTRVHHAQLMRYCERNHEDLRQRTTR